MCNIDDELTELTREQIIKLTAPHNYVQTTTEIKNIEVVDEEIINENVEYKTLLHKMHTELSLRQFYNYCLKNNRAFTENTIDEYLKQI